MTNRGLRLNERAPDIVVADEPHPQRNAGLLGVAHRRAHARVGQRHDHVGVDGLFDRQHPPEIGPHFVHAPPEDVAVGTREVDMLEHTVRERCRAEMA